MPKIYKGFRTIPTGEPRNLYIFFFLPAVPAFKSQDDDNVAVIWLIRDVIFSL